LRFWSRRCSCLTLWRFCSAYMSIAMPDICIIRKRARHTFVTVDTAYFQQSHAFPPHVFMEERPMEHQTFDRLTRLFGTTGSRRTAWRALLAGALLGATPRRLAAAPTTPCTKGKHELCGGNAVPASALRMVLVRSAAPSRTSSSAGTPRSASPPTPRPARPSVARTRAGTRALTANPRPAARRPSPVAIAAANAPSQARPRRRMIQHPPGGGQPCATMTRVATRASC
jgi:hypothetical protein